VIPTYNVEKYVEKTLESLLGQTRKNFEILVIDDNSTDDTVRTIENVLTTQTLIPWTLVRNQTNLGPGASRNLGIEKARGEYLIFLDGDDQVEPMLVELLEEWREGFQGGKEIDIFLWKYMELTADGTKIPPKVPFNGVTSNILTNNIEILKAMLIERTFHVWTTSFAVRRSLVEEKKLRFPEHCRKGEDLTFIIKMLAQARIFCFLDIALSYYVQRGTSVSRIFSTSDLIVYKCLTDACELVLHETKDKELFKACKELAFFRFLNYFEALSLKHRDAAKWSTFTSKLRSECNVDMEIEELVNLVHKQISQHGKLVSKRTCNEIIKLTLFRLSPRIYRFLYRLRFL